jgi:hypothetical protein
MGSHKGWILGRSFSFCTADLLLVETYGFRPHLFADDSQIYGYCRPDSTTQLQSNMSACIDNVASWMKSNRLQLNASNTEVLWCTSSRRQHQLPVEPLRVCSDTVTPVQCVRDLGIYVDSDLSMRTHVQRTVSSRVAVLRQLRSIRRSVSIPVKTSLVVSLVLTRFDYGSATLV